VRDREAIAARTSSLGMDCIDRSSVGDGRSSGSPAGESCLPRLKPTVEVIRPGDGNVYLLGPSRDHDLVLEDAGVEVEGSLRSLDGSRTLEEIRAAEAEGQALEGAVASIEELWELGWLEDAGGDKALSDRERDRLDRQLRYFGDVAPAKAHRSLYQRRLRDSTVAVLGLGGLGSWTALALACTGIGKLVLADGDVVEESNFNRQVLYTEADLGTSKAHAAAAALSRFDSAVELEVVNRRLSGAAEIRAVVAGADMVVDAPTGWRI
jgi:molybdopterin-synthase adenylyltransferase